MNTDWVEVLRFTVQGKPQPAGSKRSMPLYRHGKPLLKDGRVIVNTVDANPKAADWKRQVANTADAIVRRRELPLLDCPLRVYLFFFVVRPQGHYGSGKNALKLKPSAPPFPLSKPDVLKLTRGVEDALTGIVYRDDARIVEEHLFKEWADRPGVQIVISIPKADAQKCGIKG